MSAESVGLRPLEFRHLGSGGIELIPCQPKPYPLSLTPRLYCPQM